MHMVPELYKELLGRQTLSYPWTSVPSLGLLFLFGVDELQRFSGFSKALGAGGLKKPCCHEVGDGKEVLVAIGLEDLIAKRVESARRTAARGG